MSKQKTYILDPSDRRYCAEAADRLKVSFPWKRVSFPDLTDLHEPGEKWCAVYKHLKKLSKKEEEENG